MSVDSWQTAVLIFTLCFSFLGIAQGFYWSWHKRNPFGLSKLFLPLGAFVWGDLVIFGPFWFFASLISLIRDDWILFLLIVSLFWLVRSIGETIYWLNEQFTTKKRNKIEDLQGHELFGHSEAVYFGNQIVWQMMTVVTAITSIYLTATWVNLLI